MLHLTNGDCAAKLIRESGVTGQVLPWRDVLHEGPVPGGRSLQGVSEVRARFLAEAGWGSRFEELILDFRARDATLEAGLREDEIVLWFEADLYDQLQISQILDWLGRQTRIPPISLICPGGFAGIDRFVGLGQLSSGQVGGLFPERESVTRQHLDLATEVWEAFTSSTPAKLNPLLDRDTALFPFLAPALRRLLELYPSEVHGLDRTESQLLRVIAEGRDMLGDIFPAFQDLEERPFMGDSTLWSRLLELTGGPRPALSASEQTAGATPRFQPDSTRFRVTDFGGECLKGAADYREYNPVDRWIGGTHLAGQATWRWSPPTGRVRKYPTTSG